MSLSFKGQTVVVTGAGGGLGKTYAQLFASRGANVVVNDVSKGAADKVVDAIVKAGGKAVSNTASVTDGEAVIKTAIDAFGSITILINNAGILRDKSIKNMTDKEWDQIQLVHLKGSFACSRAAWPYFRKQKYGRIVNTASAAGLYGNMGQANYSAAKMGLVGFTKTLAREGAKYNIFSTVIAPLAASAMTETVMPPEMLAGFKPEFVAPFVASITHPEGPDANGKIFEVGAGYAAEVRWERSPGAVWKPDDSFTPSAVKEKWAEVIDFEKAEHPESMADRDIFSTYEIAKDLPSNKQSDPEVRFDGKTVIVTGAGGGLGRAYAVMYAKLGANVVVNDVSPKGANAVVEEIVKSGGKAVAAISSAEDGDAVVKTALDAFGGVHVLIANAGILRDKSFTAMTEKDWDDVIAVHLRGTYKCVKAVWAIFQKQKYGRIVTTASGVGIYGNFGQANYGAAKAAIIGLTRTIAIEGRRYGILANCIAPAAGTSMSATIWSAEMVATFKPDYVAPIVGYLSSESNEEESGKLFETFAGWAAEVRWQRAGGYGFPVNKPLQPEDVIAKWGIITNFEDGRASNPTSTQEAIQQLVENFSNQVEETPYADAEDSELVVQAKKEAVSGPEEFTWDERDAILYNLGIGANETELQWTYEGHEDFSVIPTFGVIPPFGTTSAVPLDWLPNFNPAKLLHGEQYLAIKGPIPTSGTVVTEARLLEVLDKGKAAAVTVIAETKDKATGKVIFENQQTVFVRGAGGFGGKRTGSDRGSATAANAIPKRKPDAVIEEKTQPSQAALYRLSGDRNPLHILPEFAAIGGFDKPILHGLCSLGFAGKHVLKSFGEFNEIKTRFAGVVFPGETLVTEMWKEGSKVIFTTKVKERNSAVLAAAAATLVNGDAASVKAKL
ncbi:hypothetical protein M422DRAFT_776220 [Sphaerobolus stellatus SS14]|nr:hypothetical protein M422DRAFT_776220 [Sphaerobolus stellatus SS14]